MGKRCFKGIRPKMKSYIAIKVQARILRYCSPALLPLRHSNSTFKFCRIPLILKYSAITLSMLIKSRSFIQWRVSYELFIESLILTACQPRSYLRFCVVQVLFFADGYEISSIAIQQIYLTHRQDSNRYYHSEAVNPGILAIRGYFTLFILYAV